MSSKAGERAQQIAELRARFPDADVEVIEDSLTLSHHNVESAANMLIGFGCLPYLPPPPSQHQLPPPSQHQLPPAAFSAPSAPHSPHRAQPQRSSVFDAFKPDYVERAFAHAKGNDVAALEVLLSLGQPALAPALSTNHRQPPSFHPPPHAPPAPAPTVCQPVLGPCDADALPPAAFDAHGVGTHPHAQPDSGIPLAMLSTAHAIRQSQQMYEQEMRGKKIHVFVDLSNVAIGAQVGPDGKRDVSIRINVSDLVDCVYQGRDVKGRYLVTSVAKTLDGNRQPTFIRDWQKVGFDVRVQDRRGGSEQMLDEVLIVSMQATIMKFGASKLGTGPDQKQHTLVLLSGDGNTNHDHHSFAETIESALADGMFVEVWAWRNSVSRVYTQGFMKHYGGSFTVRYFDDYRDCITRKSNAGSAAADDDDGDWMVCPITCEVIIDAAATKYAPKRFYEKQSLENWVRVRGSCPLTRMACSPQDIISCTAEMRARLQKHAQRPSYSPPPPAARAHTGAAAADAGTGLSDTVNIPVEKIRVLIGPSGATIKQIRAQTGAEIHVDDDGTVRISGSSADVVGRAKAVILSMFKEIQVGETLQGVVVSVKEFGCFVQITPGKDGLVHISELAENRVSRVEDVVKVGDVFAVKCIGVDEGGRVRLSRKAALKDRERGR